MLVNLNSSTKRINSVYFQTGKTSYTITKPETKFSNQIAFAGERVVTKTITTQIAHEKTKLLKQIKDILATEVPVLSEEDKAFARIQRAIKTFKLRLEREEKIEEEIKMLSKATHMTPQQIYDRAQQLRKEFIRLGNLKIEELREKEPCKDNYDYALINKFKNAILDDNFNLEEIRKEHYKDLETIETVEEFKKKYPSIRIPKDPKDVITDKILETLNRQFYLNLDELFNTKDEDTITAFLIDYFIKYFEKLAPQLNNKTAEDLLDTLGFRVSSKVLESYERFKIRENFDSIPEFRKNSIANVSDADRDFFDLDYNTFVLSTLKKMYLNGEKLNKIEYTEGSKKINIPSIKASEYKFEKIPEKIKKVINEAQKPAKLQRDYLNYTKNELKTKLENYSITKIAENEEIFDLMIEFNGCKFTEEDKQYLIKFLQILDKITDKELSIDEALESIRANNIRPYGTDKLNELERIDIQKKLKQEQQKIMALNQIREKFNDSLNSLYEINLQNLAEQFAKFYPETLEEEKIKETNAVIDIIQKSLKLKDPKKIKNAILRWEIFKDYSKNSNETTEIFKNALEYAKDFDPSEIEQKSGQYLLNRELVEDYPASLELVPNSKLFKTVMEKYGHDKNLATISLCKYEDYSLLNKEEKSSILNILNIFDAKNPDDRTILKYIIEKDYINSETTYNNPDIRQVVSMTATPKRAILEKYKFPGCLELFVAFEEALSSRSREGSSSGIKKTGTNNNALAHKMEVKIVSFPDRLFSSKNNYKFDIYSERGLH